MELLWQSAAKADSLHLLAYMQGGFIMLALTVKAGDYITIGDNVVIQMLKVGDVCRVAIDAPREMTIERAKVHEQRAETPECIRRVREKYQS